MGFERVAIFGLLDVDLESTSGGLITLATDLPGNAMAVRETRGYVATGRRILRYRLAGTVKGRLYSLKVGAYVGGVTKLFGAKLWVRILPGQAWEWMTVPVPQTSDWEARKLAIPGVGEWEPRKLDIPPVSEWTPRKLDIPGISEWTPQKWPIKETPQNFEWVNIPMDA